MSVEDIDVLYYEGSKEVLSGKKDEIPSPKNLNGIYYVLGFKIWNLTATGYYAGFQILNKGGTKIYDVQIQTLYYRSASNVGHNSYLPFVDQYDTVNNRYGAAISFPARGLPLTDPVFKLKNDDPSNNLTIHYELWVIPKKGIP